MVGKSGAFVLSVPVDPDSTQYHPLFYRADACGGKSVQCTVAICFLLSINDFVEKLWKDVLDPFLFIFFGAFQIVLLYLFGQSIIAVDMFLNLVTTNSSEAMELLDNLVPALVSVIILYIPALILAVISIIKKRKLSPEFIRRERKKAWIALLIGFISLGAAYGLDKRYELKSDLYPANVCYNVALAFQRNAQTRTYHRTSENFTFNAQPSHPEDRREIYIMVVGETSRALNWSLYDYDRDTNPELSKIEGVTSFCHVLTESNTTHKSVPMLLSPVSAQNFDSIYYRKSIITAFKEAGFQTAFFSNQRYNHSFIDFFGMEADTYDFIKEDSQDSQYNPSDDDLLMLVEKELEKEIGNSSLYCIPMDLTSITGNVIRKLPLSFYRISP